MLWDILPTSTLLGGAPFNFTYRINNLGNEGLMISRLGTDKPGEEAFKQIQFLGLNTKFIQWDHEHETGAVKVSFDANNNPDYLIIPNVAYDFIEATDGLMDEVAKADCLCFGTLAQRSQCSRKTVQLLLENTGKTLKFLDINLRKNCYSKQTILFSLEQADILKLNEHEVFQLADIFEFKIKSIPRFCETMIESWLLKYCIVTLAEKGAYVQSAKGERIYSPGYKINLIDSIGSGDAFSAGFIHKVLMQQSMQQACEFGNIIGAIVATQQGATVPITTDDIENFIHQNNDRRVDERFEKLL